MSTKAALWQQQRCQPQLSPSLSQTRCWHSVGCQHRAALTACTRPITSYQHSRRILCPATRPSAGSAAASPAAQAAATAAPGTAGSPEPWHDSSRFQEGVHYVQMAVRDYELDQFSVVNNAVYASYVQHGRHIALEALGLSVEGFQAAGTLMALSRLALDYRGPLRAGDSFYVTTAIEQMSAARVVLAHSVVKLPGGRNAPIDAPQVVVEGTVTLVFLDPSYRPVRVPTEVRGVFRPLMEDYLRHRPQSQ